MNYIELSIETTSLPEILPEILIANLSQIGFESFVHESAVLLAYIPEKNYNGLKTENLLSPYFVNYFTKLIPEKNWNTEWEQNFKPVVISDKIYIRATFHKKENYPYELIIEPKMSFGTGHHETTSMMCELMLQTDFRKKNVLDMGCGTGILAVLASKLGATQVLAIDNDEWAYNNTLENIKLNDVTNVQCSLGDISAIEKELFHVVLANINMNVLKNDIATYAKHLKSKGMLLLSGFYDSDINEILAAANASGLVLQDKIVKNNWAACNLIAKSK
ncbi:MAG: 50S ribosomal protein L11 methyltransferase [Bacteroidales bacterium]|nr:50S ribosomal protein L11 methyltransferase [Bacteroidales bacterium]HOY38603.1 50S ribosomal protein L11 methyltransferase [Bacteroidales bacterium]